MAECLNRYLLALLIAINIAGIDNKYYCSKLATNWTTALSNCKAAGGNLPKIQDPQNLGKSNRTYLIWTGDVYTFSITLRKIGHVERTARFPNNMCVVVSVRQIRHTALGSKKLRLTVYFDFNLRNCWNDSRNYIFKEGKIMVSDNVRSWVDANNLTELWTVPTNGVSNFTFKGDITDFPMEKGHEYWVTNLPEFQWNGNEGMYVDLKIGQDIKVTQRQIQANRISCGAIFVNPIKVRAISTSCESQFRFLCDIDSDPPVDYSTSCETFFEPTIITQTSSIGTTQQPASDAAPGSTTRVGVKVGVTVGILVFLIVVIIALLLVFRKRLPFYKIKRRGNEDPGVQINENGRRSPLATDVYHTITNAAPPLDRETVNNPKYDVASSLENISSDNVRQNANNAYDTLCRKVKSDSDNPTNLYDSTRVGESANPRDLYDSTRVAVDNECAYDSTLKPGQKLIIDDTYHHIFPTEDDYYSHINSSNREDRLQETEYDSCRHKNDTEEDTYYSETFGSSSHDGSPIPNIK